MDRRQKRTRNAIFAAFTELLRKKNYESVTVQEIIDLADIGRSTFYAHFETKDDLVRELCEELFDHIIISAMDRTHPHGLHSDGKVPESIYYHMLKHLEENDFNVLTLLSCESGGFFTDYYKEKMKELVKKDLELKGHSTQMIPEAYLVNHISASFVEMVKFWVKRGQTETCEELSEWFETLIGRSFSSHLNILQIPMPEES